MDENKIRLAFENLKPDEDTKQKMLENILSSSDAPSFSAKKAHKKIKYIICAGALTAGIAVGAVTASVLNVNYDGHKKSSDTLFSETISDKNNSENESEKITEETSKPTQTKNSEVETLERYTETTAQTKKATKTSKTKASSKKTQNKTSKTSTVFYYYAESETDSANLQPQNNVTSKIEVETDKANNAETSTVAYSRKSNEKYPTISPSPFKSDENESKTTEDTSQTTETKVNPAKPQKTSDNDLGGAIYDNNPESSEDFKEQITRIYLNKYSVFWNDSVYINRCVIASEIGDYLGSTQAVSVGNTSESMQVDIYSTSNENEIAVTFPDLNITYIFAKN